VQDVMLAREIIETIKHIDDTELEVRIPKTAKTFAENILSDWFEAIAEVEKMRGNMPYLINRDLYSPGIDGNDISWNQSLRKEDFKKWFDDEEFTDRFREEYLFMPYRHKSEDPLSGYLNRIFPVKFVLRVLVTMTLEEFYDEENGRYDDAGNITLDQLRTTAFATAKYAKEWLSTLDLQQGPKHGSEVSVGFPENNEKARERFVAQFVGSKRKGNISGALFDMGFASLTGFSIGPIKHNTSDIHFTKVGWDFALLENPLLDSLEGWKDYFVSGKRFSEKEIEFLLVHLESNLSPEWKFMQTIASSIEEGNNRPKSLEECLVKEYDWEATKASQMRNGALSRMEELCLIKREKSGREVTYHLTEFCKINLLRK
jgi:hypothetical protein